MAQPGTVCLVLAARFFETTDLFLQFLPRLCTGMLWVSNTDVEWTVKTRMFVLWVRLHKRHISGSLWPTTRKAGSRWEFRFVSWEFSDFSKRQCPSGTPLLARNTGPTQQLLLGRISVVPWSYTIVSKSVPSPLYRWAIYLGTREKT